MSERMSDEDVEKVKEALDIISTVIGASACDNIYMERLSNFITNSLAHIEAVEMELEKFKSTAKGKEWDRLKGHVSRLREIAQVSSVMGRAKLEEIAEDFDILIMHNDW